MVERNPVIEKKSANYIMIALYAFIVFSFLITIIDMIIRFPLQSQAVDYSDIQLIVINILGIIIQIVFFTYGLYQAVKGTLSPKRMGVVIVAYFGAMCITGSEFKMNSKLMLELRTEIDHIVYRYSRGGYVDWYHASEFTSELRDFLNTKVMLLIEKNCLKQTFELTNLVFQCIGNIDMDDSDGGSSFVANICAFGNYFASVFSNYFTGAFSRLVATAVTASRQCDSQRCNDYTTCQNDCSF